MATHPEYQDCIPVLLKLEALQPLFRGRLLSLLQAISATEADSLRNVEREALEVLGLVQEVKYWRRGMFGPAKGYTTELTTEGNLLLGLLKEIMQQGGIDNDSPGSKKGAV